MSIVQEITMSNVFVPSTTCAVGSVPKSVVFFGYVGTTTRAVHLLKASDEVK